MDKRDETPSTKLAPLAYAWLALVLLTLASVYLGQWFHGAVWLQPLVAAIIWLKGIIVARRFIEIDLARSFIRRMVYGFIAFTPIVLVIVSYFGDHLARWTTL